MIIYRQIENHSKWQNQCKEVFFLSKLWLKNTPCVESLRGDGLTTMLMKESMQQFSTFQFSCNCNWHKHHLPCKLLCYDVNMLWSYSSMNNITRQHTDPKTFYVLQNQFMICITVMTSRHYVAFSTQYVITNHHL